MTAKVERFTSLVFIPKVLEFGKDQEFEVHELQLASLEANRKTQKQTLTPGYTISDDGTLFVFPLVEGSTKPTLNGLVESKAPILVPSYNLRRTDTNVKEVRNEDSGLISFQFKSTALITRILHSVLPMLGILSKSQLALVLKHLGSLKQKEIKENQKASALETLDYMLVNEQVTPDDLHIIARAYETELIAQGESLFEN